MIDVEIGRLRVCCRASRGETSRALAVRARMMRVAAGPLPAAIDRALADDLLDSSSIDVEVANLAVPLDFDPGHYDDETLCVLWADRIRAALLRQPSTGLRTRADAVGTGPRDAVAAGGPITEIARWVAALLALDPVRLLAVAAELQRAGRVIQSLEREVSPEQRRAVLDALWRAARSAGSAPRSAPVAESSTADPEPPAATGDAMGISDDAASQEWVAAWRAASLAVTGRALRDAPSVPGRGQGAAAVSGAIRLVEQAARAATTRAGLRDVQYSRVAGLLLVYPWLAAHLRAAAIAHPTVEPADVRRVALAMIADPAQPLLQHDPMVKLLAGAPLAARAPTCDLRVERGAADEVLRAFAAMVRGFEESSPDFLRQQFVVRDGEIETRAAGLYLNPAARPLDLALALLPYPLTLLRLPWTEPLVVTWPRR